MSAAPHVDVQEHVVAQGDGPPQLGPHLASPVLHCEVVVQDPQLEPLDRQLGPVLVPQPEPVLVPQPGLVLAPQPELVLAPQPELVLAPQPELGLGCGFVVGFAAQSS